MTISTDIIKNPTALSLRVNKAVVDYIRRNRMVDGRPATIKTSELLHVAYNCVGIADQILATEEERTAIVNSVKTCLTVLEEVQAIKPAEMAPTNFVEYLQYKKQAKSIKQKPIHGKAFSYAVESDFAKKVSALKTNEIIERSDVVGIALDTGMVSVLTVKGVSFEKVKFCNSMFDYTKFANYIGCYNEETNKVDFVSTASERKIFFGSKKQRVLPDKRDIINLYYLVNLSEYKKLFFEGASRNSVQTILSLRAQDKQTLSTENLSLSGQAKYV